MPALRLRSLNGPRRGQEFVFSGPRVRIGRSRDNDLVLPERDTPESSAHHAEALLDDAGTWWIVDVGSSNGTRVNDVFVARHALTSGDQLILGNEMFRVAFGAPRRWAAAAVIVAATALVAIIAVLLIRQRARSAFEEVAAAAARSVFLVAVEQDGRRAVVGTAFAVGEDGWLATNAHIAAALQKQAAVHPALAAAPRRAVAVASDTYDTRQIVAVRIHDDWRAGSLRNDVALIRVDAGRPLVTLPLADETAVASLRRGTPIAAFGFPAVSTDAEKPRGRLSVDVVGDVRGDYLEVGLGVAPGTSGSPVLDESGTVVGIVAGGDFVDEASGAPRPSGSLVNWAVSVNVVRQLLARSR